MVTQAVWSVSVSGTSTPRIQKTVCRRDVSFENGLALIAVTGSFNKRASKVTALRGTRFTGTDADRNDTGAWEGCDPDDDGAPIACSTLSPSLGSGIAVCKSDCVGYDLSNCENQGQVYVPNGPFMMGCNEELDGDCGCRETTDYTCIEGSVNDEEAYHEVLVSTFLIDKYEASVSKYIECSNADSSRCAAPTNNSDDYDDYSNFTRSGARGNHPMNFLNYERASEFCAFNNKRLPTEAEWEKAARGTDGRVFPWGEGLATCERAWVNDWYNTSCDDDGQGCTTGDDVTLMELDLGCGQGRTTDVTSKSAFASPYGAVNMVGNVNEWVVDCYGATYYQSETMSYQNPKNVDECDPGDYGVLRGGSFSDKSRNLRTSYRRKHGMSQNGYKGFGVRCVQDVIPATGAFVAVKLYWRVVRFYRATSEQTKVRPMIETTFRPIDLSVESSGCWQLYLHT